MRFLKLTALGAVAFLMCGGMSWPVLVVLSDGTRMLGEANATLFGGGSFSASSATLTCSGTYNAWSTAPTITAYTSCTDGRRGIVVIARDETGQSGSGVFTFDDGDTAVFAFGARVGDLAVRSVRVRPPAQQKQAAQDKPAEREPEAEPAKKAPAKPLPPVDTSPPEFPLDPTGKAMTEVTVALEADPGGTFTVPVFINKSVEVKFFVDSGAADIMLPSDVATTLMRNDALLDDDIYGEEVYSVASGGTTKQTIVILKELNVGGARLKNVKASIGGDNAPLLLGQSFLKRFGAWSLDNQRHVLVLKAPPAAATPKT